MDRDETGAHDEAYTQQLLVDDEKTLSRLLKIDQLLKTVEENMVYGGLRDAQILTTLQLPFVRKSSDDKLLCQSSDQIDSLLADILKRLAKIDEKIPPDFGKVFSSTDTALGDANYCFGTVAKVYSKTPILRGFAELVKEEPIGPIKSDKLLMFLISVPNLRGALKRENHGFGYHYHYLDKKSRRSDSILTFANMLSSLSLKTAQKPTLLFEMHAEKKADFHAKMDSWGDKKRVSTYTKCAEDLKTWSVNQFKAPNAGASPLWPLKSVRTK